MDGALSAILAWMREHTGKGGVQACGCHALSSICSGADEAALARRDSAAGDGALGAIVAAMEAHGDEGGVQEEACRALATICHGADVAARARKAWAAGEGAVSAIVASMHRFNHQYDPWAGPPKHVDSQDWYTCVYSRGVQEQGGLALKSICDDQARKDEAVRAGARNGWLGWYV